MISGEGSGDCRAIDLAQGIGTLVITTVPRNDKGSSRVSRMGGASFQLTWDRIA
jgi:hypothetical protein